jgi:hypothetical protein
MVLFERQTGRPSSRFGGLSTNMFFTRNSPQPLRVRHIEGVYYIIIHPNLFLKIEFMIFL